MGKRIARVFPRRTSMTPADDDVYLGPPPFGCQPYDDVNICVTFTWDIPQAFRLARAWQMYGRVRVGGPAMGTTPGAFVVGRYLRRGVTITSRGCPFECPWCLVPSREGTLRELRIQVGNVVQDNNFLACNRQHQDNVFAMLQIQHAIQFKGGLQASLINDWVIEKLRALKIDEIWTAYDSTDERSNVQRAIEKLRRYFPLDKVRCYVLIGYHGDTLDAAEGRLRWVRELGALPFAMRFSQPTTDKSSRFVYRSRAWTELTWRWSRAAVMRNMMRPKRQNDEQRLLFAGSGKE